MNYSIAKDCWSGLSRYDLSSKKTQTEEDMSIGNLSHKKYTEADIKLLDRLRGISSSDSIITTKFRDIDGRDMVEERRLADRRLEERSRGKSNFDNWNMEEEKSRGISKYDNWDMVEERRLADRRLAERSRGKSNFDNWNMEEEKSRGLSKYDNWDMVEERRLADRRLAERSRGKSNFDNWNMEEEKSRGLSKYDN
jgi:hypothetical protein